MPQSDPPRPRPRPRAATCEDWDEATDAVLPETRTSANVAVKRAQPELRSKASYERRRHDGSDSGYSSKAGTIDSDLSAPKKMTSLKINTGIVERERQPYSMSQAQPEARRQSSNRPPENVDERQQSKPRKFKHEKGICGVCDHYGWHVDLPKDPARTTSKPSVPPSPQKSRPPLPRQTSDDHAIPTTTRRMSGARAARPLSMHTSMPVQFSYQTMPVQSPIYAQPLVTPQTWSTSTPLTPSMSYTPTYQYASIPTPQPQITYLEHVPASYEYFQSVPSNVPEIRPPNPPRRSTGSGPYGEPVIRHVSGEQSSKQVQRKSSQEQRPASKSHKSSQSESYDRTIMPPPPRPDVVVTRRPSLRKSTTYTTSSSNRRSVTLDDEHVPSLPPVAAPRERRSSPARPPSSYRGPQTSEPERPDPPQKAQSYSAPVPTPKVTSSDRTTVARRTTLPSSLPRERHEDEAEAYQRDRRSLTSNDLMAEALRQKDLPKRDVSERSETGSSKSQRSGSRASSGGHWKTHLKVGDVTIITDGPVSMDKDGNIKIETRAGKSREDDGANQQKRIERAPSVTSRTSKVSAHSGNVMSNAKVRDRDRAALGMSRRMSRPEFPPLSHESEYIITDELPEREEYEGRGQSHLPDDYERRPNSDRSAGQSLKGTSRSHSRPPSSAGRASMDQARRRGSYRDDERAFF